MCVWWHRHAVCHVHVCMYIRYLCLCIVCISEICKPRALMCVKWSSPPPPPPPLSLCLLLFLTHPQYQSGKFGDDDVEALLSMASGKDFLGVDIFLTSDWPRGVENYTTLPVRPLPLPVPIPTLKRFGIVPVK